MTRSDRHLRLAHPERPLRALLLVTALCIGCEAGTLAERSVGDAVRSPAAASVPPPPLLRMVDEESLFANIEGGLTSRLGIGRSLPRAVRKT